MSKFKVGDKVKLSEAGKMEFPCDDAEAIGEVVEIEDFEDSLRFIHVTGEIDSMRHLWDTFPYREEELELVSNNG